MNLNGRSYESSMEWPIPKDLLEPYYGLTGQIYHVMNNQMPLQTNARNARNALNYLGSLPTGIGMKQQDIPIFINDIKSPSTLLDIIPLPEIPKDLLPSLANSIFTPKYDMGAVESQTMINKSSSHAKRIHRVSFTIHL